MRVVVAAQRSCGIGIGMYPLLGWWGVVVVVVMVLASR